MKKIAGHIESAVLMMAGCVMLAVASIFDWLWKRRRWR